MLRIIFLAVVISSAGLYNRQVIVIITALSYGDDMESLQGKKSIII